MLPPPGVRFLPVLATLGFEVSLPFCVSPPVGTKDPLRCWCPGLMLQPLLVMSHWVGLGFCPLLRHRFLDVGV